MKPNALIRILSLALVAAVPVATIRAETPTAAEAAWKAAVQEYLKAAGEQLKAIRAEADAEVKRGGETAKARYLDTYFGLDRCDRLLEQLRYVGPSQFDYLKAAFEQGRAEMVKALEAARKGG